MASILVVVLLLAGAATGAYFLLGEGGSGNTFPESYVASSYDVPAGLRLVAMDGSGSCDAGPSPAEALGMTENPGYMDAAQIAEGSDPGEPLPLRVYMALYVGESDCSSILISMAAEMKSEADVDATIAQADGPCSDEAGGSLHVLKDGPIMIAVGTFPGSSATVEAAGASLAEQIEESTGATKVC